LAKTVFGLSVGEFWLGGMALLSAVEPVKSRQKKRIRYAARVKDERAA
jgi:hypothetical protein